MVQKTFDPKTQVHTIIESTFNFDILTSHKTIAQNNLHRKRNLDIIKQVNEDHQSMRNEDRMRILEGDHSGN